MLKQIAQMHAELKHAVKSSDALSTREGELMDTLDELLATERKYLTDLQHTCTAFLTPLASVLDAPKHAKLFANLKQIEGLHKQIESEVGQNTRHLHSANEKAERIASGFQRVMPFFRMYSTFCASYAGLADALRAIQESAEATALVTAARDQSAGVTLEAYLFRPVQRMCAYPLFFQKALKNTADGSPQRKRFQALLDNMQEVINAINEDVRRNVEQQRAADVLLREVGGDAAELLSAHRRFFLEVDVDMQISAGGDWMTEGRFFERRKYRWFLFSDQILVCRPSRIREGFKEKARLLIDAVKLVLELPAGDANAAAFEIHVIKPDRGIIKYKVWAEDLEQRDVILKKLYALIPAYSKSGHLVPSADKQDSCSSGGSFNTSLRYDSLLSRDGTFRSRSFPQP